jgi:putative membrane protein
MRNVLACGTVVLACVAAPAFAQNTSSSAQSQTPATQTRTNAQTSTAASMSMKGDQAFVTKAAQGGMAEVELGKLAAQKAQSPDVKNFAQRMVDDHSKANDELKSLASQKNITLPAAVSAKDKADYNRLSKLSGTAFDRAYMQHMLADHRTDISEFQYEARSGQDSDVRGFASKTLPTLQEHLKMAQTTNGAVATSGVKTNNGMNVNNNKKTPAAAGTNDNHGGSSAATGTTGANGSTGSNGSNGSTTTR